MADVDPRPPGAVFDAYVCPDCDRAVVGVEGEPNLLRCERCGKYFEIPLEHRADDFHRRDDEQAGGDDQLSSLRIRQLAVARRAAYRSRSHCVIAAIVCVVAVVQLAWNGVALIRAAGWATRPVWSFLGAIFAAWGAVYFVRKAIELDREAKRSAVAEPTSQPDFAPLSDGSQRWKNLEEIR